MAEPAASRSSSRLAGAKEPAKIDVAQHRHLHQVLTDLYESLRPDSNTKCMKVTAAKWKEFGAAIRAIHPDKVAELAVQQHETTSLGTMLRFHETMTENIQAMEKRLQESIAAAVGKAGMQSGGPGTTAGQKAPAWGGATGQTKKKPEGLEIILGVRSVPKEHALRAGSELEAKEIIEKAISDTHLPALQLVSLHGIRRANNETIILQARTDEEAKLLRQHSAAWGAKINERVAVVKKHYTVVAMHVPKSFDPSREPAPANKVYDQNCNIAQLSATSISEFSVLNKKLAADETQRTVSLKLTVDNAELADNMIYQGLSINGRMCRVRRFAPGVTQCFRCQGYGHIAARCESPEKCLQCAGPHKHTDCPCTSDGVKCQTSFYCMHAPWKCANCKGAHTATDPDCPARAEAITALHQRLGSDPTSPYHCDDFTPVGRPGHRRL